MASQHVPAKVHTTSHVRRTEFPHHTNDDVIGTILNGLGNSIVSLESCRNATVRLQNIFVDTQKRFQDYANAQQTYLETQFVPIGSYNQLKKAYDELSKTAAGWKSRLERHQLIDGEADDLFVPRSDLEACIAQLELVKAEKDSMGRIYEHHLSGAREEVIALQEVVGQQYDMKAASGQILELRSVGKVESKNDGTRSQSPQIRRSRRIKP